ncbi:hypothetical protein ACFOY2_05560 [Nonomuraea purpurea]|uniref:Uncharacterized protein n=1 Tax=Nonomuraea purpurea TaxID=1849276 RepID=A0ABV8FY44_9ACTN
MARLVRVSISQAASEVSTSHFTRSHASYREYLEYQRMLMMDIALLLQEDAGRAADWHRERSAGHGLGHWLHKFFLSLSVRGHGKNAAEALTEAAKSVVQMSLVHGEYVAAEVAPKSTASATVGQSGRYRVERV